MSPLSASQYPLIRKDIYCCKSTWECFECIKQAVIGESEMQCGLTFSSRLRRVANSSLERISLQGISFGNVLKREGPDHSNSTCHESFEDVLKVLEKRTNKKKLARMQSYRKTYRKLR